jgi:hypothetical protein
MAGTAQDYIAQLDARLGKPYSETLDGGVGPDYYDCSGLVMVCLNAIGIPYTRSTYTQWADQRYQHFGPFAFGDALPPLQIGDVLYMHVDGEADPGHVGTYDGAGVYLDAPHTGAFVRVEAIPNTPSEHVYGIIRPPFATFPPPPPQEAVMVTPMVSFKPNGQLDYFQVAGGSLLHKWNAGTGWLSESLTPAGRSFSSQPQVAIVGGACWVTADDTTGSSWAFVQTPASDVWNNSGPS